MAEAETYKADIARIELGQRLEKALVERLGQIGISYHQAFDWTNPVRLTGHVCGALEWFEVLRAKATYLKSGVGYQEVWATEIGAELGSRKRIDEFHQWLPWSRSWLAGEMESKLGIPLISDAPKLREFWEGLSRRVSINLPIFRRIDAYMRSGLLEETLDDAVRVAPQQFFNDLSRTEDPRKRTKEYLRDGDRVTDSGRVYQFHSTGGGWFEHLGTASQGEVDREKARQAEIARKREAEGAKLLRDWTGRLRLGCERYRTEALTLLSILYSLDTTKPATAEAINWKEVYDQYTAYRASRERARSENAVLGHFWRENETRIRRMFPPATWKKFHSAMKSRLGRGKKSPS